MYPPAIEWTAAWPQGKPDVNSLPQEWVDAFNAAVKAGKIPDIPPTTLNGNPVYPQGYDPLSDTVCSATYKCRNKEDLWDAPDGVVGGSFDDGPLDVRFFIFLHLIIRADRLTARCSRPFRSTNS